MLRFLAVLSLSLTVGAPLAARAEAPAPAKKPVVMHYRALSKMLRRFSRQAGTPTHDRVLASAR